MRTLLALCLLLCSTKALGHARWKLNGPTPPRSNDTGLKGAPCGGKVRGSTSKTFTAGSAVTVEWEETINHPGRFEIYFSEAGDLNFQLLGKMDDNQNDSMVPHSYSMNITLPNKECPACTLQLVQVMLENPASPTYYYSCSDIELKAASTPPPPPPPNPPPDSCNP